MIYTQNSELKITSQFCLPLRSGRLTCGYEAPEVAPLPPKLPSATSHIRKTLCAISAGGKNMIKKYSRTLNENERQILNNDIEQIKNQVKRSNKTYFIMLIIILAIGIPLAISQAKGGDKILGYLAFGTLAVYLLIVLWVKIEEKIKSSRSVLDIKTAITNNSVEVLHCQSNEMIKLEEFEDEGPHYLFRVEDPAPQLPDNQ